LEKSTVDFFQDIHYNLNMNNIQLAKIELQMLIIDVLNQKRLEGVMELTLSELIDELGLDTDISLGFDDSDTISITDQGLEMFEYFKDIQRSSSVLK
jgi:hypothetical protein